VTDSDNIQSVHQVFVSVHSLARGPEVYMLERERGNSIDRGIKVEYKFYKCNLCEFT
jgi:hypothetical protein